MVELDMDTKRSLALNFLKSHTAGVLASIGSEGKPHASVVYFTSEDDFSIFFLTLVSSRKYAAIRANPNVAFVIGTLNAPQTLQLEGVAVELHANDEMMGKKLPELLRRLTENATYFAPITKMDPSDIAVMWLQPKWIRWADYATSASGDKNVFTELAPQQGFIE